MGSIQAISEKRESIQLLAGELAKLPQIDCPVKHRFSPGLYIREIFMEKDSLVIGKIHATEHFNIILSGECIVVTAEGNEHHKAGDVFISKAGVQKCVANLTDVVWLTTHVTEETDLEKIEKQVIVEDYDQLEIDSLMSEAKRLL